MDEVTIPQTADQESTRPGARNRILSARFSESEYSALERRAWQAGKTIADWAREILLRNWHGSSPAEIQNHIFTELVAIELVVMNALEPLLRGEKLSSEETAQIFREVQTTKATRAQQILSRRTRTEEK
jgi:hypothetical protein